MMFRIFVVAAVLCCVLIKIRQVNAGPKKTAVRTCSGVHPLSRVGCGYPGISQQECESKKCCWDNKIPGVKWCFYPAGPACSCVHPRSRVSCGHPGIKERSCASKGCCWDVSNKDAKSCFYPAGPGCSNVHPLSREECGYPGIEAEVCAKRGCCWDSSIRGVKWCFYPPAIMKESISSVNPTTSATEPTKCAVTCPKIRLPRVCGSDGNTYPNFCLLKETACQFDEKIKIDHPGPCAPKCSQYCTREYNPQCGTDGQTYGNPCFFKYVQCDSNGQIRFKHHGACGRYCSKTI
ncbi:integumentary mucin C.1-like [Dendronephthya gigantea]|uniref:integumentary mucin C.1-like n=1 Tax=Dendronephthya gigantea TaxID=151771 RepID=UPI001068E566|nr:integumentary mucin C.1-like [Dendronephthya gigantea]